MNRCFALAIASFTLLLPAMAHTDQKLVIHEWGTFTSLQNETGEAIGGINSDDEALPNFTHQVTPRIPLNPPIQAAAPPRVQAPRNDSGKSAPPLHPGVTMRLETPVVYFHPTAAQAGATLDLSVTFRGGWLTQFYPDADVKGPGVSTGQFDFRSLTPASQGGLSWPALKIGGNIQGPVTQLPVWTAPRAVEAAPVTTARGEHEKFLFYRGVGHIDAPLRVSRDKSGQGLDIRGQLSPSIAKLLKIDRLWLVDIHSADQLAYRRLDAVQIVPNSPKVLINTSASFAAQDFTVGNLKSLRADLHQALVTDGLFSDEADALLNTWEASYFKSPGLRLFFLVPREWTDHYLPIQTSIPSAITRTMVGRIELVQPEQRAAIRQIAAVPQGLPDKEYLDRCTSFYQKLGRFRDALVLDEQTNRPTPGLKTYIQRAGIQPYKVPQPQPRALSSR